MALKQTAICPACRHPIPRTSIRTKLKCDSCGIDLKEIRSPKFNLILVFIATGAFAYVIGFVTAAGWWFSHHQVRGATGYLIAFFALLIPLCTPNLLAHWLNPYFVKFEVEAQSCRKCGYDLRASKGSCPECGEPMPPHANDQHVA